MITRSFVRVRGAHLHDGYVLGSRTTDRFPPGRDNGESWIFRALDGDLIPVKGGRPWMIAIWLSPSGVLFVAESGGYKRGRVHVKPSLDPHDKRWDVYDLPCDLAGIWGLSDDFVVTWGGVEDSNQMFVWNGRTWTEIPSPECDMVVRLHGVSPRLLFAVGPGLIATYDGSGWRELPVT